MLTFDKYNRIDFGPYGIGRTPGVFVNNFIRPGVTYFLNSYRLAPWHFNLVNCVGAFALDGRYREPARVVFTGSPNDPRHSYRLRIGRRWFIGGTTPRWAIRLYEHIQYRKAVRAALEGDDNYVLCTKCGNGLVEELDGFPGETFDQCRTCGHIHNSHFDPSEIE